MCPMRSINLLRIVLVIIKKIMGYSPKNSLFVKVWQVGYPTSLKYSKDFRQLLAWDFTQFSCFNKSDTMLLVSSVKTTDFMDRRGFVAILSLPHSKFCYEIIQNKSILLT